MLKFFLEFLGMKKYRTKWLKLKIKIINNNLKLFLANKTFENNT